MLKTLLAKQQASRWYILFTVVLAGVLLFLAFRGTDWGEMLAMIRQADPAFLFMGFVVVTFSYIFRSLRWRILLTAETPIGPLPVFWITIIGYLGNSFLPARAGELIRSALIARKANISMSYVLATALTERITDALMLVIISLIALATLPGVPGWLATAAPVMAIVSILGFSALFIAPRLERLLKKLLLRLPLPDTLANRLVSILEQFLLGMRALHSPTRAFGFIGLTVVILMTDTMFSLAVARSIDTFLAVPHAMLLLAALGLSSAAPSTPGYLGIYQFVAVTILPPFGFSQSQALALIIIFQALNYIVYIIYGLLGFWRLSVSGKALPKIVESRKSKVES